MTISKTSATITSTHVFCFGESATRDTSASLPEGRKYKNLDLSLLTDNILLVWLIQRTERNNSHNIWYIGCRYFGWGSIKREFVHLLVHVGPVGIPATAFASNYPLRSEVWTDARISTGMLVFANNDKSGIFPFTHESTMCMLLSAQGSIFTSIKMTFEFCQWI